MISNDAFAGAFGGGPTQDMAKIAQYAAKAGFAVLPIEPMGKVVLCTLTARAARMADLEAQHLGLRRHPCGFNHAITDEAEAKRVFTRLAKERPGLNIAVEAGRSRMILVDADTLDSVEAWSIHWQRQQSDTPTPTVLTPGLQLPDGTWAHKDGAHFWYPLPEGVDLGTLGPGSMQLEGGISISWRDRYALVPPSVRAEGPYRLVGQVAEAPEWLLDMVMDYTEAQVAQRAAKTAKVAASGPDDIESWSAATAWADLLLDAGWHSGYGYDTCGPACEIWTRPGDAGSAKSATAHEPGCTATNTDTGWGPIHIWSDVAKEDLGSSHLSKLQFYARTQFDGDVVAAMAAAGLSPSTDQAVSSELEAVLDAFWLSPQRSREPESEPSPVVTSTPAPGSGSKRKFAGLFADLRAIAAGTAEPGPVPAILSRTDDVALFYPRTLNGLFGEPEGGKTWVALAAVAEVINRGGSAAYLDVDGNGAASICSRLGLLGADWHAAVHSSRLVVSDRIEDKATLELFVEAMVLVHPDLVVIDALGDALPLFGAKTESNDEVTVFLNVLAKIAYAGSAVVTIDHVTKNQDTRGGYAIGAQSKKARMDGAYMTVSAKDGFARGRGGSCYINKAKDRHGHVAAQSTPRPAELWGTFYLEADGGWAITPPGPDSQAEVASGEHEAEQMDRAMVLVSGHLTRLAGDAAELGTDELAITSAQAIRESQIGVRAALVQRALDRLREAGCVEKVARGRYPAWRSVKPYEALEP